jgi:hypothetical protein
MTDATRKGASLAIVPRQENLQRPADSRHRKVMATYLAYHGHMTAQHPEPPTDLDESYGASGEAA